jgi:hypothetical protein
MSSPMAVYAPVSKSRTSVITDNDILHIKSQNAMGNKYYFPTTYNITSIRWLSVETGVVVGIQSYCILYSCVVSVTMVKEIAASGIWPWLPCKGSRCIVARSYMPVCKRYTPGGASGSIASSY